MSMKKPKDYWTKEQCAIEAKKYTLKKDFRLNSKSAYQISGKNGWLEEITTHMESSIKPRGYWTKERCSKVASKYNSVTDFINENQGAYKNSKRNHWFDQITSHMRK